MSVQELRHRLERERGKVAKLQEDISNCQTRINLKKRSIIRHEKAREIIREVALQTQLKLSDSLSEIVSLALSSVFPDPYNFKVDFVQRRNKTECDLLLERNGEVVSPLSATGGGVVDVISFALRAVCWFFSVNRPRRLLILDEPFKHLSNSYMPAAGEMLQMISKKLGIQIIMVSHEPDLIDNADRVFSVVQKDGVSFVQVDNTQA